MAKFGPSQNQTNYIYHSKGFEKSYSKTVLFIGFEPLRQMVWAFISNLACFTMPAYQIWLNNVTQVANFENFKFWPNFTYNFRKSHKKVEKFSTSEVISEKRQGG